LQPVDSEPEWDGSRGWRQRKEGTKGANELARGVTWTVKGLVGSDVLTQHGTLMQ